MAIASSLNECTIADINFKSAITFDFKLSMILPSFFSSTLLFKDDTDFMLSSVLLLLWLRAS